MHGSHPTHMNTAQFAPQDEGAPDKTNHETAS